MKKSFPRALTYSVHTIRKVKFLSKNSILTKPQHFHKFFTKSFLTIFLVKSKLSTAKKSKTTTFSRVFHPKIDNFLGKSKLNFWTRNEDFEQCVQNRSRPLEMTSSFLSKLCNIFFFTVCLMSLCIVSVLMLCQVLASKRDVRVVRGIISATLQYSRKMCKIQNDEICL